MKVDVTTTKKPPGINHTMTVCPEPDCKKELTLRGLHGHLQHKHGWEPARIRKAIEAGKVGPAVVDDMGVDVQPPSEPHHAEGVDTPTRRLTLAERLRGYMYDAE
jgi:hypothetical protein